MGLLPMSSSTARVEDPDLVAGIRQVKEGDFESALLTLDGVLQRIAASPSRSSDRAQAYLYLGIAYLGLGQESLAKAKFRQALGNERGLRLSPDEFSAKVIRVFESVRRAETAAASLQRQVKKSRGKSGLILLGLGGAGAAGIAAVVTTRERANASPTAMIVAVAPEGQAIARVTRMRFSGSGSDPDGDTVSLAWDFGDGGSASGGNATHIFERSGEFHVTLSIGDGLATTTASTNVTARTLAGSWRVVSRAFLGVTEFQLDEEQARLTVLFPGGVPSPGTVVNITDPRNVRFGYDDPFRRGSGGGAACNFVLQGQVDSALQTITGTLFCNSADAAGSCRAGRFSGACAGQSQPITLIRQ